MEYIYLHQLIRIKLHGFFHDIFPEHGLNKLYWGQYNLKKLVNMAEVSYFLNIQRNFANESVNA